MRYQQISSAGSYPYPEHSIDPKEKQNKPDFCMAYAKAAYHDWSFSFPKGVFSNSGGDYQKFRLYAMGNQPISQYKKWSGVDEQTNNTWLNVDWNIRPIISTYRDRAISRLMKQSHKVLATAIDAMAKSEMDTFYNEIRAKLIVRQQLMQQDPKLANHPMLSLNAGDPMDMEELEMRMTMGEQFNRSMDAEMAVELGFYENKIEHFRRTLYEDLFDFGVGGYKEWLGDDNKAKFRKVNPEAIITNFCRQSDFSDLIHAAEVIDVALTDLALVKDKDGNQLFNEEQLKEFAGTLAGKFGNPSIVGKATGWFKPYDKFKCKVMDLELFSYDELNYRSVTDESGNVDFRKADFNRGRKATEKYERKCFKTVYKVKWIIGTDFVYEYGIKEDQKRPVNAAKKAETALSYKFYAYNFYEMQAQGYMQRLIPILDSYQLTTLKIQNFKNRAVPSGWWIDMHALESVAMKKNGKDMAPDELLQMFFDTGVLLGRSVDGSGQPMGPNWKPIIPIENSAASELAVFYQDLMTTIQQIEAMTGFNSVTTGDANPRMLVPGYETASISTDDALYPIAFAENQLIGSLASDVLLRMQQGVKKGKVEGVVPYRGALNSNSLMFLEVSPTIASREYGLILEEKTSDEQKAWLLQNLQGDIANGVLDTSDAISIITTHNAKQAMMILSYKVKKNKEQQQANQMQQIQANNQGAAQAAQVKAQLDQQAMQNEWNLKKDYMLAEKQADMQIEAMRLKVKSETETQTNLTKIAVQQKANEAKQENKTV